MSIGSNEHLYAALVITILTCLLVYFAKALKAQQGHYKDLRTFIGLWALMVCLHDNFYYLTHIEDYTQPLPLHFCDISFVLAVMAILTQIRFFRVCLYFWAFGLSFNAIILPGVNFNAHEIEYWMFWLAHGIVVGFAIFDILTEKLDINFKDFLQALVFTSAFAIFLMIYNYINKTEYGFLGPILDESNPLSKLGPYPLRLLWIFLLIVLVYIILYLPWFVYGRYKRKRHIQK